MKTVLTAIGAFILATLGASAVTHYVSPGSTNPVPPFISWTTAATNIQQALVVAEPGDEVVVTNGIYSGGLRATNRLAIRSINGPQFTIINGSGTNQCISLSWDGSLSGFTLTNGYSYYGGGVANTSTNAYLTNCTLTGNSAVQGGGAFRCTLYNCRLTGNSAVQGGGVSGCTLYNCMVSGNSTVSDSYHMGGGGAASSTLHNCIVSSNSASGVFSEGGGALDSSLFNCTLTGNSAEYAGGGSSSCYYLYNCTETGNSSEYGGGSSGDYLLNSIVYFNSATYGANFDTSYLTLQFYNCCTTPMPAGGGGNIVSDPLFINYVGGNLRLQSNSPCINVGNNDYAAGITDLDGRPRIVGGAVDMGAYEFQPGASGELIAWLQQYALPTDGSVDYSDSDGDGMNNWQEWIAGTNPTNNASALRMFAPTRNNSTLLLTWQSVANRTYFLQRATDLRPPIQFLTIATDIPGGSPTTSFVDTGAAMNGPWYYRIGVK